MEETKPLLESLFSEDDERDEIFKLILLSCSVTYAHRGSNTSC